jgi:prepilin-type N-terminal cleavage/methylation domain-containing protein
MKVQRLRFSGPGRIAEIPRSSFFPAKASLETMHSLRLTGRRGVTLVELLVVLVIISMSLAIVVPSLGRNYENWVLRTTGRRTAALFRYASDVARREGVNVAGYYSDHRFVLRRGDTILKQLEVPASITIRPEKDGGIVFLVTGQIFTKEPFVLENGKGRMMAVQIGPLPGQITSKEVTR